MSTDLQHVIGNDLAISSNGNFVLSTDAQQGQERVLRRLLTNPSAYPWHLDYGAGLPLFVGRVMSRAQISAKIKSQMRLEDAVKQIPPPNVDVSVSTENSVVANIQYVDSTTQQYSVLGIDTGD